MEPHAHADRPAARPGLSCDGSLSIGRSGDRRRGALEDREQPVPEVLHLDSTVRGKRCPEQLVVTGEGLGITLGAELFQAHGRALDVREQEGDGTAG